MRSRRAHDAQRGSITLWLLGLALALLPLGGLALDLGRSFSERRSLASAADAAALAGAGALDEARYRQDGTVVLDPVAAEERARRSVVQQADAGAVRSVRVHADATSVTVEIEGDVDLTLLRLVRGGEPFVVRVSATARPHLRP
ncbi:MAG: pilus assembly protein TadG-related protein [Acidimicrobiia bacterium]